jgi:hypothetical protein
MDKTYKIIELDLKGGPNNVKPGSSLSGGAKSEWNKASKAAEKIAVSEFEDLLNKHCKEDNDWRLDSIQTIPYTWGGVVYHKTLAVLKNMGHI